MNLVTTKLKSGGLREKHVVATWILGNHLSICFQAQGNREIYSEYKTHRLPIYPILSLFRLVFRRPDNSFMDDHVSYLFILEIFHLHHCNYAICPFSSISTLYTQQ